MPRLAKSAVEMRPEYDAVVIGSGYGGGVAASRLSRMGLKVCVVERGREWLPGEFPTGPFAAGRELQLTRGKISTGSPMGLFDVRLGADVHVVSGCGLGGTSLINANVCLSPDPHVFEDRIWPDPVRLDPWLNAGFHRARATLRPQPLPETIRLAKIEALTKSAKAVERKVERVPLHIAFEEQETVARVRQPACTHCGDCMGGCNVGAKTTVHSTYLADAVNLGAELFTGLKARFVERIGDGRWRVVMHQQDGGARLAPVRTVLAPVVVLAGGTLGTADILFRSRERGLAVSDRLGKGLSTNADAIAFGYNCDVKVNAIGTGAATRKNGDRVGPGVAGLVDLRHHATPLKRLAVVEAAIQSAMAPLLPLLLGSGAALVGEDLDRGFQDRLAEAARGLESLVGGAHRGAAANTQIFLAVGHDSAAGEIVYDHDRVAVSWPDAAKAPVYAAIEETLKAMVKAVGGTYVPNPVSSRLLGGNLLTVHPLGGAGMGPDRTSGVVNHKGQVFDAGAGKGSDAVHDGLYVTDAAVMPRSLGVHPLLTITAMAERTMLLFARDRGLACDIEPRRGVTPIDFTKADPPAAPGEAKRRA